LWSGLPAQKIFDTDVVKGLVYAEPFAFYLPDPPVGISDVSFIDEHGQAITPLPCCLICC
jgi:hypothetical protein